MTVCYRELGSADRRIPGLAARLLNAVRPSRLSLYPMSTRRRLAGPHHCQSQQLPLNNSMTADDNKLSRKRSRYSLLTAEIFLYST